jgi:hypothetical protein
MTAIESLRIPMNTVTETNDVRHSTPKPGEPFNPYTYGEIQTIADHRHYVGATPHGGNERSDSAGGGHAHCGLMCYQGGAWPDEYRGKLFMGNIHGRRINMDILKPKGSSYVASHGKDFLLANDAWARFINLRYGPDGNVYLHWEFRRDQMACSTLYAHPYILKVQPKAAPLPGTTPLPPFRGPDDETPEPGERPGARLGGREVRGQ